MTRNEAWARAYREQGAADLSALASLARTFEGPPSVMAMLAQMALEKCMKSALLGIDPSATPEIAAASHRAFDRVVRTAMLTPNAPISRIVLGERWRSKADLRGDPLHRFLAKLEASSPSSVARRAQAQGLNRLGLPCLEYPWEDPERQSCRWPEEHHEIARDIRDPIKSSFKHAIHYLQRLAKDLDSVLPADEAWA